MQWCGQGVQALIRMYLPNEEIWALPCDKVKGARRTSISELREHLFQYYAVRCYSNVL